MSEKFPKTVFVKGLPEDYSLAELSKLLESFGSLKKIQVMDGGHVLARFETGESSKKAVDTASGKKGHLLFMGKPIHVIPKRDRKGTD